MTNAEKFKETFGFEPDVDFCPFECPELYASYKCKYFEELDGGCHCETWWNEEYKEVKE